MKNVKAGTGSCRVFLRNADGSVLGYSDGSFTVGEAQDLYGESNPDGSYVSGYCCASCGAPGFENAPSS
ncbi:hypothetical protein G3569_18150 [Aliifodinibius halophilus]|uniref:Uncharacterized protein n=2 Tax=Fodinibius halophilus TaxID=1736908 RepID=A0A6M1TJQ7_9BACT|nr:hypothetical protein [Fodinibius halophilus]